jgi:hypothetical protein
MKVSELSGALLDYWIAKANGKTAVIKNGKCLCLGSNDWAEECWYEPVLQTWEKVGPIIEREGIFLFQHWRDGEAWIAWVRADWAGGYELSGQCDGKGTGPTPLIAAMRAYVASKFGETVPDEVEA